MNNNFHNDWQHLPEPKRALSPMFNVYFNEKVYDWREWLNRYAAHLQTSESHVIIEAIKCYEAMGGTGWRKQMEESIDNQILRAIRLLRDEIRNRSFLPENEGKSESELIEEVLGLEEGMIT